MLNGIGGELERYMSLLSVRQRVVAANIANADTPGYRSQDIDFQAAFANQSDPATASATTVRGLAVKTDGNNVDLDRESRLLAENAMRFQIASNLLRSQLRSMRAAIEEGRGS